MPIQFMVCELKPMCDFPASQQMVGTKRSVEMQPLTQRQMFLHQAPGNAWGEPVSEEGVPLAHSTHAEKW